MLETVAAGLLLAAVSGITILAYKHPLAYRKLYYPLIALTIMTYLLITAWSAGVSHTHARMLRFIDLSKWPEADALVDTFTPRWWVWSTICFGSLFYFAFLYYLPQLLG